jgi:NAD(P)H-nitrite reductase large subunit
MQPSEPKAIPGLVLQKDGSFALTVECVSGCVSPQIMEAVARVAREYKALVHLTMGQKLKLLGLNQESGPQALLYERARDLFQARVCVGKPFCPLALQETFSLARYLFTELARVPTPPKLKVGVSGCPACCSWANLMDLGFVGLRKGFRVIVGGHGGYRPREGQPIGLVVTHEEVAEVLRRLTQLFTEETQKKGRVDRIVENLGLDRVKNRLGL